MIYWNNFFNFGDWKYVDKWVGYLSGQGTMFEQCTEYCIDTDDCVAVFIRRLENLFGANEECFINNGDFRRLTCWGSTCRDPDNLSETTQLGVFRDYYKDNSDFITDFFPSNEPDGTVRANYDDLKGVCDEANSVFGDVNYRNMEGNRFLTADSKNVVREPGPNCAAKCFGKAGCSAFYTTADGCTFILGYAYAATITSGVTKAGKIHTVCPNNAFQNTYTRVSQFNCVFFSPLDAESIAEDIVEQNTGNPNTPLRVWNYETKSNSPMTTSSQYVSVEVSDTKFSESFPDDPYRTVSFTIETHVRVGNQNPSRRLSSELISIANFTMEDAIRFSNEAARNAAEQRQIMPRTEDIIAQIEAIERQATSFILGGAMELPENVEVAATGPIETIAFIQTAADGSIAADCSSGTCECSVGFINNGNGCEAMTVEQAATTQAPTTVKDPTDQATEFLSSLLGKLESVFDENRPGKPRTHLMSKWEKLERKSIQRYNQMKTNGCEFSDSFEYDEINFDVVNVCNVSYIITI